MSTITLHHVALWTRDLEMSAAFWKSCFEAVIGDPYHSKRREGFVSRFATLASGLKIELMTGPWIDEPAEEEQQGWDHIALNLGSRAAVDAFAARSATLGFLHSPPRETGDGFYEAIVQAPDGLRIEVTA